MSGKRFIELINLHLDGEITAEEQQLLDAEVAKNPERRRILHEHLLLQQASSLLADRHGAQLVASVDFKKYQMVTPRSEWSFHRAVFYSAGILAAACFTVLAAFWAFHKPELVVQSERSLAAAVKPRVEVFQPTDAQVLRGFSARHPALVDVGSSAVVKSTLTEESLEGFALARRPGPRDFQLPPSVGESRPEIPSRVFRSVPVFESVPEFASFDFQR